MTAGALVAVAGFLEAIEERGGCDVQVCFSLACSGSALRLQVWFRFQDRAHKASVVVSREGLQDACLLDDDLVSLLFRRLLAEVTCVLEGRAGGGNDL